MKRSYVLVLKTLIIERPPEVHQRIDRVWTIDLLTEYLMAKYRDLAFTRKIVSGALDFWRREGFVYYSGGKWNIHAKKTREFAQEAAESGDTECEDDWKLIFVFLEKRRMDSFWKQLIGYDGENDLPVVKNGK